MSVVIVTGASSGFGDLTARALARAGHSVFAGMRATEGRNRPRVEALAELSRREGVEIIGIEMDVQSQDSVDAAVERVKDARGRIDVIVHNAGHMVVGATEAFTAQEIAAQFDVNVLGAHRVNRAALPILRSQQSGLLLWVSSSSVRGGRPPFFGPYFAAKAAMDVLAESVASELIRFGIETAIVVPGVYTTGTNHFEHAGTPADTEREAAYGAQYDSIRGEVLERIAASVPPSADVQVVADEIVRIVGLPEGARPFRTHIDPVKDGSEVVSVVADRIRHEYFHRIGIEQLLPALDAL